MNCLIPWPPYSSLSCFPASLEFLLERSLKAMRVWVCVCLYHSGFDAGDSGLIPGSSHFLGWEDPLENPRDRRAWWSMVHRVTKRVCVNVCESVRLWLCTAAFNTDTKSTHAEHTLSDLIVFSSFLELFFTSTIRSIPFFSISPWDVTLGLCHDLFDLDR